MSVSEQFETRHSPQYIQLLTSSTPPGAGWSADLFHFWLRYQPVHFQRPAPVCFLNPVGIQVHGQLDCGVPQLLLHVYQVGSRHNHPGRVGVPNGVDIPILKAHTSRLDMPTKKILPDRKPRQSNLTECDFLNALMRSFSTLGGNLVILNPVPPLPYQEP